MVQINLFMSMNRVFTNGPRDRGSIPALVKPKIQKLYLMLPCLTLSTLWQGSMLKWSNPENEVAPYPRPRFSSF